LRDRGAFALGFLLIGNLWIIAGVTSGKEGCYAVGVFIGLLGVLGVYKTYR
jgi:hypothetical protein